MPFARPTLTEIIDRVSTDIASRLPGVSTSLLRRSLAGVLARAEAGAVHSLYGYLDFIARQALPDTAEDEYLLRWAAIWLPGGRKPATFATGPSAVQVTGTSGSVMPQGTTFQRSDGVIFLTTAELILGGTTAVVSVAAQVSGASGNTAVGIELGLLQPVEGFASTAVVVSPGIQGGVDQEKDPALQARIIRRIQQPPQGGSAADYETWALEVPGVTRAWVYPMQMGPGTVTVIIANDDAAANYIPSPAVVAAASSYINVKKPVTATVYVIAPVADPVNIAAQLSPNNSATQAAARAELQDLFFREAIPGGGMLISKLREAVSIASGVLDSNITSPAANVPGVVGHLPVLGTTTWSAL